VQHVVDGDLCETFARLPFDRQKALAGDLDRVPTEVLKKLEDARSKIT
jgi:splicing factor 3B subunit 3